MISVLMPCYNHGKYLEQAIKGVLGQSYGDFELILIDDGSTDDSYDIMRAYASGDRRIKTIHSEENQGADEAFQAGMEMARGDFYSGCAADDYLCDDNFFKKVITHLDGSSAAGCYGVAKRIRGDDESTIDLIGSGSKIGYIAPREFIDSFLSRTSFVTGFSAVWNMDFIDFVGGFPSKLGPQADYFINHVLPAKWGAYFIQDVTTVVRVFPDGYSSSAKTEDKIRRHALFEKMWKLEIGLVDASLLHPWRKQLIYDLCGGVDVEEWTKVYLDNLK